MFPRGFSDPTHTHPPTHPPTLPPTHPHLPHPPTRPITTPQSPRLETMNFLDTVGSTCEASFSYVRNFLVCAWETRPQRSNEHAGAAGAPQTTRCLGSQQPEVPLNLAGSIGNQKWNDPETQLSRFGFLCLGIPFRFILLSTSKTQQVVGSK